VLDTVGVGVGLGLGFGGAEDAVIVGRGFGVEL
jgi:hypothetical protein